MEAELKTAIIQQALVIAQEATVQTAIAQMIGTLDSCGVGNVDSPGRYSCAVVEEKGKVIGILTQADLIRLITQGQISSNLTVGEVMTESVVTMRESAYTDIFTTINLVLQHKISHLPIVDDKERLVGLVTTTSLGQAIRDNELLRLALVKEVMTTEVVTATEKETLEAIAQLLVKHQVSSILIVTSKYPLIPVGMVTESDLVRFLASGFSLAEHRAGEIMSTPVVRVRSKESLARVQLIMEEQGLEQLVVTGDQGELLGIVSQSNLLQVVNPLEMYKLVVRLGEKVNSLTQEKRQTQSNHHQELQHQAETHIPSLNAKAEGEKLIANLALQIRSCLELATILNTTVAEVRRLLKCDRVNIWQYNEGKSLVVAESTDSTLSLLGQGIYDKCFRQSQSEVYRQGKIRIVTDIYATEMSDCHREILIRFQTRSKILLPLVCGDELWGFLNITESSYPRVWQTEEVELVKSLGVHLAIAIQQAMTHNQLHKELREKQQLIKKLQAREKHYSTLTNAVPVGIFSADIQGKIIYINPQVETMLGLSPAEIIGTQWQDFIHDDDRNWVMGEIKKLGAEKLKFQGEYRIISPPKKVTWVYGQLVVEQNIEGEIIAYISTITDISDRKQAEQELQQTEKRLQEAQRIAHLGHWELDLQSNYLYWSPQTYKIFELEPEEFGASYEVFLDTIHPDDRELVNNSYSKHLLDRDNYSIIHRLLMRDGRIKYVQEQCETVYAEDGTPIKSQGTVQDITEQHTAQLEKEWAENALLQIIEGTNTVTGENFFPKLVRYLSEILDVRYAVVSERVADKVNSLGFWANGAWQPAISYSIANTPCENLLQNDEFYCETGLAAKFPLDLYLLEMQAESYLGIALRDEEGELIGILCLVDVQPLSPAKKDQALPILKVLVSRAIAELRRYKLYKELETRVKQRTAQLQERETRYRALMEGAGDAILVADFQGNVLEVNHKAEELFGYDRELLTKMDQSQLHPPEDLEKVVTAFGEVIKGGRINMLDVQILRQDGQKVSVDISASIIDLKDKPIIHGIFRDITERKQAELALKATTEDLDSFFSLALELLSLAHTDGYFLRLNQQWENILGYSINELEHKDFIDYVHPEDVEKTQEALSELTKGKKVQSFINRYRCQDGTYRWLDWHSVPKGNLIYSAARDITARVEAEAESRRQRERETLLKEITQRIRCSLDLQTIFNTACAEIAQILQVDRVAIFKFDSDSDYNSGEFVAESVLPDFVSVLGVSVQEHCFGANYAALYTQGHYYVIDDMNVDESRECHRIILSGFQVRANLVMPLLCGEQLWGLLCIHQCRDKRHWEQTEINLIKQLASQLAIAIQQANLFEQLQQEQQRLTTSNEQLAISNAELARATRLKDEFLANMSHELRTPLNAIMGMTEGLQEGIFGQIRPQQSKALETIERSSSHLLDLINDILDVAKIESGNLDLHCTYTSISSLCQSSLSFVKQLALKKRIQIKRNIPANLPELFIDELRIRQVLLNLLNNAVKFTPSGGSITLDVSLVNLEQTYLRLAVIDTGIGIAPENLDKLFQPFVQIDSALNRQYQGTGLGLKLVKQLVELHGGQVRLTSEVGVGSCFTVDLPAAQTTSIFNCTLSPDKPSRDFSQPCQDLSAKILLVEDNEANINTIASYLEAKGYHLLYAKNGQEGINLAKSALPDLILMDVQMPEMDGLEAIKQIRSDPRFKELPIIALTALAMDQDGPLCLAAGADVYLSKPIKLKQLVTTIQQRLSSRKEPS